jgi:SAM-dependent methyltransferase
MDGSRPEYLHGTHASEQARLSTLNALLNGASLDALALRGGERILDVGSGLAQFARAMARAAGGPVLGVERSADQVREARRKAEQDGESSLIDLRRGDAADLPLNEDEWGRFDVAHARFLLEHVRDPLAVVREMVRAVRPGGRIVLEDDDHDLLRLYPAVPEYELLWHAYIATFDGHGFDPWVGRRLVSLLHRAGAQPVASRTLFFGSCAGSTAFETMVANFVNIVDGARHEVQRQPGLNAARVDAGLDALRDWSRRPDSALWYSTCWAEGRRRESSEE